MSIIVQYQDNIVDQEFYLLIDETLLDFFNFSPNTINKTFRNNIVEIINKMLKKSEISQEDRLIFPEELKGVRIINVKGQV